MAISVIEQSAIEHSAEPNMFDCSGKLGISDNRSRKYSDIEQRILLQTYITELLLEIADNEHGIKEHAWHAKITSLYYLL